VLLAFLVAGFGVLKASGRHRSWGRPQRNENPDDDWRNNRNVVRYNRRRY